MNVWRALHIFYHSIGKREKLLLFINDIVQELKFKKRISSWFYINYWEGGPHVRLRLKDISDVDFDSVRSRIEEYIRNNPSTVLLQKEQYYKDHKFDGVQQDISSLPWYGDNIIVEIEYIPETKRYGGINCIGVAEDLFQISSEKAMSIIKSVPASPGVRLSLTVDIYIASLEVCKLLDQNFLKQVSEFWKIYSDENIEKMLINEKTAAVFSGKLKKYNDVSYNTIVSGWREAFREYHEKLIEKISDKNIIAMVLVSQLHMLSNRLSIPPAYEYMITKMISVCLENGDECNNE